MQRVLGLALLQRRIGIFDQRIDGVIRLAFHCTGKIADPLRGLPYYFLISLKDSVVVRLSVGGSEWAIFGLIS